MAFRRITEADLRVGQEIRSAGHHTSPVIVSVDEVLVRVLMGGRISRLPRQFLTETTCYVITDDCRAFQEEEVRSELLRLGISLEAPPR